MPGSQFFSAGSIKNDPPKTPLDPKAAVVYGDFINVAYQMFEQPNGPPLQPPQPPNFPAGYRLAAWIIMSDFALLGELVKKFYGFIATEIDDPHSHILVMRGTEGPIEWWDDAVIVPIPFAPVPSAGLVHMGFYRIYHSMELIPVHMAAMAVGRPGRPRGPFRDQPFADQVEELLPPPEELPPAAVAPPATPPRHHHFVVTGHSLGAALCTLYVMEHAVKKLKHGPLSRKVTIERVCTFASPRVGLKTFTTQFDALPIDSWRIANTQDLVPKVPPPFPVPFRHVDTAYDFSSAGVVKFNPVCWHSMNTYQHWLDPSLQIEDRCRL